MWSKIKTIWKNKLHILRGFWNKVFKTDPIEEMASIRLLICLDCPDIDMIGKKCMLPGTHPCCGKCGCSLAMKLRDPSSGCGNEEKPRWNPEPKK
jgi:hypothetical protein